MRMVCSWNPKEMGDVDVEVDLLISTEKVGQAVLLRIDRIQETADPEPDPSSD